MSLYPRVSRWCGLRRLVYSCGWSWSRLGLRVPILCRVVDPARWSWAGAGTETLCFADLFVRWFGRDMFRDVLIGPFWAHVSPSSGGVLLGPAGRAYVSFCRRLVGWRAFRFSFVVVTHTCTASRCSWYSVFTMSVRRRFCSGSRLSVVRLRSILGVWYVGGMSWLYRVRFAKGPSGLGPGFGSTSPSLVTSCIHPFEVPIVVGCGLVVCGCGAVQVCVVVAGSAPCHDPCLGYRVSGDITPYRRRGTMSGISGWCIAKYLHIVQ